ncbi:MAG: 3-dehydroquinate synthase [Vulcanimicrobiaceae bacterium]
MPVSTNGERLTVASGQGAYDVDFVATIDALHGALSGVADARTIVDARVLELYPALVEGLDPARLLAIPATEDEKTLQGVERVCRFFQATDTSKRSTLIVVGGGIAQDIGAFAAHIYYRGIPYVLVPTTLLSMADSCIGAKCGVNLGSFKNQLGFFQSPKRVIVYRDFVKTLSPDDLRSGFGEVLKLAITDGGEAFEWFETAVRRDGLAGVDVQEAVRRSLTTKRTIIERDEYEADLRKTLNYGHSFSHAIEGLTDHAVPHGLGVAWGIDVANYVAMRKGLLARETFERLHALLRECFSFRVDRSYDAAGICVKLKRDKKAAGSEITLVLATGLGQLTLVPTAVDSALEEIIASYLAQFDIFSQPALGSPSR